MAGSCNVPHDHDQHYVNRSASAMRKSTSTSQHYKYSKNHNAKPLLNAYTDMPPFPTTIAASSYTIRSVSNPRSGSSITAAWVDDTPDASRAVWSPLKQWTEGACTANRDRLVGRLSLSLTSPNSCSAVKDDIILLISCNRLL